MAWIPTRPTLEQADPPKRLLQNNLSVIVLAAFLLLAGCWPTALRLPQPNLVFVSGTPQSPSLTPAEAPSAASPLFVTVVDGQFVLDGQPFRPNGSTSYPYWDYNGKYLRGSSWVHPEFANYLDTVVALAQNAHLTILRPTNYFDGIPSTAGSTWWKNDAVWLNMDYLLKQAALAHLHILLDLSSFRDRLLQDGRYPYTASDWQDFLNFVGQRYANDPTILNYALAGEVVCPNGNDPLRPASPGALIQFYDTVSTLLHNADQGHHLISTGGLSYLNEANCGIDWQTIFSLPHIDLTAIHVYSDGDRTITLPAVAQWAAGQHKPFTVEEFGFRQSMGDAQRADAFRENYRLCQQYHVASVVFWNLGNEVDPKSFDVSPQTPLTWNAISRKDVYLPILLAPAGRHIPRGSRAQSPK